MSHLVLVASKALRSGRMGAVKGLLMGFLMAARCRISIADQILDMGQIRYLLHTV